MKRLDCICLAALALLISNANSFGAEATLEWENAAFCQFATKFDPAKYHEEELKNTINAIFNDDFDQRPSLHMGLIGPGDRLASKTVEYQQECEQAKDKLANLPVIELPGMEDYRKLKLEELEDWCRVDTLQSRAASGDPSALREYTPSAAQCSSFIDALEGKTDIRAVWREVVNANCRTNADPQACKSRLVAGENRSDNDDSIKLDVLTYGWMHCSVPYLKVNNPQNADSMRAALQVRFRRLFRTKAYPCGD